MTTTFDQSEPGECARCGQRHVNKSGKQTCAGHRVTYDENNNRTYHPCGRYPIKGGAVCPKHGGSAPHVRAAAAEREAAALMRNRIALELRDIDPKFYEKPYEQQLLDEIARSAQAVEWLADRVAELYVPDGSDDSTFRDVVSTEIEMVQNEEGDEIEAVRARFVPISNRLYGRTHTGDLGIHPVWNKLDQERDRHVRYVKTAIDAGISERMVRLAESQAQQIVAVIVAVIDGLDLTPVQRTEAKRLAADRLRAIPTTVKETA